MSNPTTATTGGLSLLLTLFLVGCGQKGPLYIPGPEPEVEVEVETQEPATEPEE